MRGTLAEADEPTSVLAGVEDLDGDGVEEGEIPRGGREGGREEGRVRG